MLPSLRCQSPAEGLWGSPEQTRPARSARDHGRDEPTIYARDACRHQSEGTVGGEVGCKGVVPAVGGERPLMRSRRMWLWQHQYDPLRKRAAASATREKSDRGSQPQSSGMPVAQCMVSGRPSSISRASFRELRLPGAPLNGAVAYPPPKTSNHTGEARSGHGGKVAQIRK
jgi:hypothetical protein